MTERIAAEHVAIVVAHPDDETIGIGGQLARLQGALIVHLTNGAPADMADARARGFNTQAAYVAARRDEFKRAMEAGKARHVSALYFAIDDQKLATHMAEAARRLATVFAERRTEMVLTHPYEGGHPDHDAAAFTVRAAALLVQRTGGEMPHIGEMAFYHAGEAGVVTQRFPDEPPSPEIAIALDDAAWARKQRMFAAYVTQGDVLAGFGARTERLRVAPTYDFEVLPNRGRLHYETFLSWRGQHWQHATAAARAELRAMKV